MDLSELLNIPPTNYLGAVESLDFLKEDAWLQESAVIGSVSLKKGFWEISLVFVQTVPSFKLLKRFIATAPNQKVAEMKANIFKRTANKSSRNKEKPTYEDFDLCPN